MSTPLLVLHLEDDPADVRLVADALREAHVSAQITAVEDRPSFVAALENGQFDLILADYKVPGFDGLEALNLWRARWPSRPFLFVTGSMGDDLAVESLRCGAADYILKGNLSQELSPPSLHDFGLGEALRWLGNWMRQKHGLRVQLDVKTGLPLPEDLKLLLFHSVRELLLNVVRHAGVKQAAVKLAHHGDGHVEILVRDRGKGFDPQRISQYEAGTGLGLFSIRERLQRLGGEMEIQSAPTQGSEVRLTAPL